MYRYFVGAERTPPSILIPSSIPGKIRAKLSLEKGNRVHVVQFGRDIQLHEDTLFQSKTYTNALVKTVSTKLRLVDHNYQWIINTRTVIEDVSEDEISFHTAEYSFILFDEFHKCIDLDGPIGKTCKV
uniref:Uncharacterized protein n=1 Tax=Quercus lobata TaxID=97700 RepID=A0A7N2LKD8_QUELO